MFCNSQIIIYIYIYLGAVAARWLCRQGLWTKVRAGVGHGTRQDAVQDAQHASELYNFRYKRYS